MGTTDSNNWTRIQQSIRETGRLVSQKQYNMAMIKARQTLEFMVNCLGEKALIVDGDLADSIDQLYEGRWISQATKDRFHRIRVIGNKAVHDGNDSPYDANEAYELLSHEAGTFADISSGGRHSTDPATSQQHHAAPQQHHAAPQQHYTAPQQHHPTPQQHHPTPQQHHPTPQQHSAAPQQHHATPQQHHAAPQQHHAASQQHYAPPRPAAASQRNGSQRSSSSHRSTVTQRSVQHNAHRPSSASRSRRRPRNTGFNPYDLMRPTVIFLIILVVVLACASIIKSAGNKGKKTTEAPTDLETAATQITTEATTAAPETTTEAQKIYKTTANPRLNVRAEPSAASSLLGTLAVGTIVEYVETYNDEWTIIKFEGKDAYVSSQYLSAEDPSQTTEADSSTE